jgi:hypothetical protein
MPLVDCILFTQEIALLLSGCFVSSVAKLLASERFLQLWEEIKATRAHVLGIWWLFKCFQMSPCQNVFDAGGHKGFYIVM